MTDLDTRRKILTPEQAVAVMHDMRAGGRRIKLVSGYFDVLQPAMVRALAGHAGPGTVLVALVLDPPNPVIAAGARAELAASLRVVDFVLPCATRPDAVVERLQPAEWVREEEAHAAGTERLITHVVGRHQGELEGRKAH